ncbi:MAG: pyocin knob domain-containing protein [Clostridia bacterium]
MSKPNNLELEEKIEVLETKTTKNIGDFRTDLNNLNYDCKGYANGPSLHRPSEQNGYFTTQILDSNWIFQIFTNVSDKKQYFRNKVNNVWQDWVEIWNNSNCPILKQEDGYFKLANGLIIQWGFTNIQPGTDRIRELFPITFPVQICAIIGTLAYTSAYYMLQCSAIDNSKFDIILNSNTSKMLNVQYIAIGY